jgi:tetratricopeptide (TPR) repeat protein
MPEQVWIVMREAPAVIGGYDDAMEVVPEGKPRAPVLESVATALDSRLPATRVRLDAEIVALSPRAPAPAIRAASDAVDDVEAGPAAPWCSGNARGGCIRAALEKAAFAQQVAPDKCDGYALTARARAASGDQLVALNGLEKAIDVVTDRVACLRALALLSLGVGDRERALAAREKIVNAGCEQDWECIENLTWVAAQEEVTGNLRKALAIYRRAHERAPENDDVLESTARLAAALGLHAEAAEDYERLARKHPQDRRWKPAAEAERDAAVRAAVRL